jgi:hypothetical protein
VRSARTALGVILALVACGIAAASAPAADYAFTPAAGSPFHTNVDPPDVVVADIDADGFPDVVLGDGYGSTILIYWGVSGGTFGPTPTELDGDSDQIVVARLDGDADLDIAGAGYTLRPFFKNDSGRTFTPGPALPVDTGDGFEPAVGLVAANFDGDADNDLAMTVLALSSGGPSGAAVRVFKNQPTGTFAFDHDELSSDLDYVGDIVVGRFDGDADPDLAYGFEGGGFDDEPVVSVLLGAAGVEFTPAAAVAPAELGSLAVADLDGDGNDDLVSEGSVDIHWGNGDGTFGPATEVSSQFSSGFFFGDFNNDGLKDLGLGGDPVRLLTNKGSRTFALGAEVAGPEFGSRGAAAHLDADPRDDLVLAGLDEMTVLHTIDPPSGGGGGGGDTTPPPAGDTPPPPPGSAPPLVVPPGNQPPGTVVPVKASRLAVLPGKRVCGSRRKFRIRLRVPPEGVTVTEARVLVNGKKVKVVKGARLTAPVDLRGLPKGRAVVTIRITLADGRVLRGKRVYHPCAKKKRKGRFGRNRV